ncbi:hypothetical protein DL764_005226 [Monosporascus ibericus]|uniref:NACHT-NTPase and P-loop NTPases N-terminal domain-containing protein n=1 Tax=Monosporascus ibericus TaxID=155417 RepID=A0A4Q4TCZ4_9PEZI|nr:hypothetical protein DL764_005226 [Monosporascus ibericus]
MSGTEVIGLISAIMGIIDVASKFYTAIENTNNLPQAFREIAQRLPLVLDTLGTMKARFQPEDVSSDAYAVIWPTMEGCKDKAERLKNILRAVAAQPDPSRIERYRLAVRRLGKESKVEELMKGIIEDVQLLAANRIVQLKAEDKIDQLTEAIQALSKVPSSVPDGPTFTYSGTGDQINNTGSGTQNINKGRGQQYIAHSISFGSAQHP